MLKQLGTFGSPLSDVNWHLYCSMACMKNFSFVLSLSAFLLVSGALAEPSAVPGLSACYNPGDNVRSVFTVCLRGNFNIIAKATGLKLTQCYNPEDSVNYFFPGCIRSNFKKIGENLRLNLKECYNPGDSMAPFFPACVRENFEAIGKK